MGEWWIKAYVDEDTGVGGRVSTGEVNGVRWEVRLGRTAADGDLGARWVELGETLALGVLESDDLQSVSQQYGQVKHGKDWLTS